MSTKKNNTYGGNMRLFTSYWNDKDTFKMMPIVDDCPYTEVIYDPSTTLLVVIGKTEYEKFQLIPRLDPSGNVEQVKHPKPGQNPHKQQRVSMRLLQEYYITDKKEQEEFIKAFAVNADEYDYSRFLRDMENEPLIHQPEKAGLVDEQGMPLKTGEKAEE